MTTHSASEALWPSSGSTSTTTALRFGLLIAIQLVSLVAGYLICPRRLRAACFGTMNERADSPHQPIWRLAIFLVVAAIASAIFSLALTTNVAGDPSLDTFHEGESLGPAAPQLRGQAPYHDIMVTHGPFQDPLRSLLAFRLFGKSIGAERTVQSLLKVLEFALIGVLVVVLLTEDLLAAMLALAVLLALHIWPVLNASGDQLGYAARAIQRDITTCLFLMAIIALYRHRRTGGSGLLAAWAASFVAVGAFAYSTERGIGLTLACLALEGVVFAVYSGRARLIALAISLLGLGCGAGLLGWSVQWYWVGWARWSFLELPSFLPLAMGSTPYRIGENHGVWPLLLVSANVFWVALMFLRSLQSAEGTRRFVDRYFVEMALVLVSLFQFWNTFIVRSDWATPAPACGSPSWRRWSLFCGTTCLHC